MSASDMPGLEERLQTGIPGLDAILCGGVLRGGIYIIQGAPGAGKTILGNQICFHQAAQGARALYITLLAESHSRMITHMRRMAFFDESAIPDGVSYFGAFKTLDEEGLKGLLDIVRREVRAANASLLILDGLITVTEKAGSDLELKKFVHELQTQAVFTGCTMFLLTSASEKGRSFPPERTMVDGLMEIGQRFYGRRAERHIEVSKLRGSNFLSGTHSCRITTQGLQVFPRLESMLSVPSNPEEAVGEKCATGVNGLDEMLGGGVDRHSFTLVLGPAGSGKTTAGLQFLSATEKSQAGLHFSFNENPAALRLKAAALRLPLEQMVEKGQVHTVWQPSTEGLVDQICAELLDTIRARKIQRLVIDDIGGFERLAAEKERTAVLLPALCNELRSLGVTTLATAETKLSGIVPGQPLAGLSLTGMSPVAENIVLLRHAALDAEIHRLALVLKARDSRIDLRMRRFEIRDGGIEIDKSFAAADKILRRLASHSPDAAPSTDTP